ncbi:MAG: SCO family protein [Gemmatimonadaceae bacterium]
MKRVWLFAIAGALTTVGLVGWTTRAEKLEVPFYRSAELTPEWLTLQSASSRSMHHALPFALTDQNGATITADAFASRATVIHFFFTTCAGVCPTTQGNLARMLAKMSNETRVQVLSHSVTPERDSVPMLKMYADMHNIQDTRWHLLTGPRTLMEQLARESYFVNLNNGRSYGVSDLAHTETLVLIDGAGRIRGVYTGSLQLDIERLAEDIHAVLAEKS